MTTKGTLLPASSVLGVLLRYKSYFHSVALWLRCYKAAVKCRCIPFFDQGRKFDSQRQSYRLYLCDETMVRKLLASEKSVFEGGWHNFGEICSIRNGVLQLPEVSHSVSTGLALHTESASSSRDSDASRDFAACTYAPGEISTMHLLTFYRCTVCCSMHYVLRFCKTYIPSLDRTFSPWYSL